MSGQFPVFLGRTITKQWIKCLAQGHTMMTPFYPQSNALLIGSACDILLKYE